MEDIAKEIAPYIITLLSVLAAYIKIQTQRAKTAKGRDENHESNVVRIEKMEWALSQHDKEIREVKESQNNLKSTLDSMNNNITSIATKLDILMEEYKKR